MAVKIYKPITPSLRNMTGYSFEEITKTRPERSLIVVRKKRAGRNAYGRVTVRLFVSRNHRSHEFATPGGRHRRSRLPSADVVWVARILWASQ